MTTTTATTGTSATHQQAGGASVLGSIAPLLLMLVAFYFLLMRPQQKREAKRREMINSVKRGDRVVLTSGIIGTIHKIVNDCEISLEISENVRIRILKNAISDLMGKPPVITRLDSTEVKPKNDDAEADVSGVFIKDDQGKKKKQN